MSTIKVDFARLRATAKAKKLSSYKIAKKDGQIAPATIVKILNGSTTPTAVSLKRICDVLDFPIEDAFTTKAAA